MKFDISKVERLSPIDVLKILKEKGIVVGSVVMDSGRLIRVCHLLGVRPPVY